MHARPPFCVAVTWLLLLCTLPLLACLPRFQKSIFFTRFFAHPCPAVVGSAAPRPSQRNRRVLQRGRHLRRHHHLERQRLPPLPTVSPLPISHHRPPLLPTSMAFVGCCSGFAAARMVPPPRLRRVTVGGRPAAPAPPPAPSRRPLPLAMTADPPAADTAEWTALAADLRAYLASPAAGRPRAPPPPPPPMPTPTLPPPPARQCRSRIPTW